MHVKPRIFLIAASCLFSILGNGVVPVYAQDKIVAVVNKDVITQKDLDEFMYFMSMDMRSEYPDEGELEKKIEEMKPHLLNRLIEDRLILQEAKKNTIPVDEARIKEKIADIKKQYPTEAEFQQVLRQRGLVQADIETRIREQFLMYNIIDIKVRRGIVIAPAEVTDFYEKNKPEFKLPEERQLEVLTIADAQTANGIFDELTAGASFDEAAKKHGIQASVISAYRDKELKKEIGDVVFALEMGGFSKPVETENGCYIFKLTAINPPKEQSLAEVQEKIREYLYNQKMQGVMTKWLNELKAKSYIKIF